MSKTKYGDLISKNMVLAEINVTFERINRERTDNCTTDTFARGMDYSLKLVKDLKERVEEL